LIKKLEVKNLLRLSHKEKKKIILSLSVKKFATYVCINECGAFTPFIPILADSLLMFYTMPVFCLYFGGVSFLRLSVP
jgi:hypothetical protein